MKTFRKQENVADYSLEQLAKTKPFEVRRIKKYVGGSKLAKLQTAYNMCEYSDLKEDFLSNKYYKGTLKSSIFSLIGGFLGLGWLSLGSVRAFGLTLVIGIFTFIFGIASGVHPGAVYFTLIVFNLFCYFKTKGSVQAYNSVIAKSILDGVAPSKFPSYAEFIRNKIALLEGKYHAK